MRRSCEKSWHQPWVAGKNLAWVLLSLTEGWGVQGFQGRQCSKLKAEPKQWRVNLLLRILFVWIFFAGCIAAASAAVVPNAPSLAARSWLLADANSGRILATHQINLSIPPASLTKIMTGYVIAQELAKGSISLDDQVRVSTKAWRTEGSRMFIRPNTSVLLEDLLRGVIIQSGNDASVALAEHVAGDESSFADLMNFYAANLGMKNTKFFNATGLTTTGHQTTAKDIYLLTRSLIRDFPRHYRMYSEKSFAYGTDSNTGKQIVQRNRNRLLWLDDSVDGVKTGHTQAAGYCLVTSALRDGMRLIAVVMGAASEQARLQETQKLLTYGFRFFESHNILRMGQEITPRPMVWGGNKSDILIGVKESVWVTIPRGKRDVLVAELELTEPFWAPLQIGDQVGVLRTSLDGKLILETPIRALDNVEANGLLRRAWARVSFFFYSLWHSVWDGVKEWWLSLW